MPLALLLSGFCRREGESVSLSFYQIDLVIALRTTGWEVYSAEIARIEDIQEAFSLVGDKSPLLVVYTGVTSRSSPRLIHPYNQDIDLASFKREGPTSYIIDGCSSFSESLLPSLPSSLPFGELVLPSTVFACLDPSQKFTLVGTSAVLKDHGTTLTYQILSYMAQNPSACTSIRSLVTKQLHSQQLISREAFSTDPDREIESMTSLLMDTYGKMTLSPEKMFGLL